jgi:hypothetical protein
MQVPDTFIELDRRFREPERDSKAEDSALTSYSYDLFDRGFGWADLLQRFRVVVLGEPGSGKTWEFRNQARRISAAGGFGFFVRLDQLISQPLQETLAESKDEFARWKQGRLEASFFLDSVDEAKFRSISEFYAALDHLRAGFSVGELFRAKLFLSSRISEWQPSIDPGEFLRRFPLPPVQATVKEKKESGPFVVQIQPLGRSQVEQFVSATGFANASVFVKALDDSHAWDFARRPIDVRELAQFWAARGRIGSLTEILEFDVASKLRSRPTRDEFPLSDAKTREGAEWLAAAVVFSRKFSFRVPDESSAMDALDARASLPGDWDEPQHRALLSRSIFDGAAYGRVRFHHRRVTEYLAASWLSKRVEHGYSRYELHDLLFATVRGRRVIRPSLAPVAAWLCSGGQRWNEEVRNWVLEAAPAIHFRYGDPAQLSIDYKQQLLTALSKQGVGRRRIWIESTYDSLARLADERLSAKIAEYIRDQSLLMDFRLEMLELVRHGRLAGCLDAVIDVLANEHEPKQLKTYAASALHEIDDQRCRTKLAGIAHEMPVIQNHFCAKVCEALYPKIINASELIALLRKTEHVNEHDLDLPFYLKRHFEEVVTPEIAGELLTHLLQLAETPPHAYCAGKPSPVSDQFRWAGRLLPIVLLKLFAKKALTDSEVEAAARAAWLLGHVRECHEHIDEDMAPINVATTQWPHLRRSYFAQLADEFRTEHKREPHNGTDFMLYWEILRFVPSDSEWLLDDVQNAPNKEKRVFALRTAVALWDSNGRRCKDWKAIRKAVGGDRFLRSELREIRRGFRWLNAKRFWWKHVRYKSGSKWWWIELRQKLMRRIGWYRGQIRLLLNLRKLESGKAIGWLAILERDAEEERGLKFTPSSWSKLERTRGKRIASAAQVGYKRAWRNYCPPLPHEKTDSSIDSRLVVGLAGIQLSLRDGELDFSRMSADEARLSARYAVNELNGFAPWIYELAAAQPQAVREILVTCIKGEWLWSAEHQGAHEVIYDLVYYGETLVPVIRQDLFELFKQGDPPNKRILHDAAAVLVHDVTIPPSDLLSLISSRASSSADNESFVLWVSIWLQFDATAALEILKTRLQTPSGSCNMVRLCSMLSGKRHDRSPQVEKPSYLAPEILRHFIPLVYQYVKVEEDIDRKGSYTPTARDDAQDFRNTLLDRLAKDTSLGALNVLIELADEPVLARLRDWILNLIDRRVEQDADLEPWSGNDLRDFAANHEVDPKNDRELYGIVCKRLNELKNDVEKADKSFRSDLRLGDNENLLRKWVARWLVERSRKRYTVPEEEEIDLRERPDIRVENPKTDPVSIEVKWADNWTLEELLERLENQLAGQYLRAHNTHYGVYLLGYVGKKQSWKDKTGNVDRSFDEVVKIIRERAEQLTRQRANIGDLYVISFDFTEPVHVAPRA